MLQVQYATLFYGFSHMLFAGSYVMIYRGSTPRQYIIRLVSALRAKLGYDSRYPFIGIA